MLGDLGKIIVAKGFKKLPQSPKIARSGLTAQVHLKPSLGRAGEKVKGKRKVGWQRHKLKEL